MDNLEAIETTELTALLIEENGLTGSLVEELAENTVQRFKAEQAFAKSKWWPNLNVELFQGTNQAPNAELYQGIRLGAQSPLQLSSRNNEISQSKLALKAAESEAQWLHQRAKVVYAQLDTERKRLLALLQNFENEVSQLNEEALKTAQQAYEAGEIAYLEYAQTVEAIRNSELQYLDRLLQYNRVIIQLRYFDFNV
jgi:cobalt-zinc-cadmium resistance protein CzcA